MYKVFGVVIIVAALVAGILPAFTDCQSQGKAIALANGKTVAMKCHWTGRAELALAIPAVAVGAMLSFSRRKENKRNLAIMGSILGVLVMLVPTSLIGVCSSNMICNTVMEPTLLVVGGLVIATSAGAFAYSFKKEE